MADNFTARIDSKYIVIFSAPDVCKIANGTPVPFPITERLSHSTKHAKKTRFNGKKAFMFKSHTTRVTGDQPGVLKGIKSNSVGAKAEPIDKSSTVRVEKSWIVRVGDKFHMNQKNTIGTLVLAPPPVMGTIQDNGEINEP